LDHPAARPLTAASLFDLCVPKSMDFAALHAQLESLLRGMPGCRPKGVAGRRGEVAEATGVQQGRRRASPPPAGWTGAFLRFQLWAVERTEDLGERVLENGQ
jgi:hypothetical protein